jgi:hypothetical protein
MTGMRPARRAVSLMKACALSVRLSVDRRRRPDVALAIGTDSRLSARLSRTVERFGAEALRPLTAVGAIIGVNPFRLPKLKRRQSTLQCLTHIEIAVPPHSELFEGFSSTRCASFDQNWATMSHPEKGLQ